MQLKHIPMDGPQNFRDIGGFLNRQGLMVAWNRLYRADTLKRLSEKDVEKLRAMNVRTIVDLRGKKEQETMPDVVPEGIRYCSCPMMKEEFTDDGQMARNSFLQSLMTGYQTMVKDGADLIGRAAQAVMEGVQDGAVVFHCTAGKDRTGILAAVLLLTLDVCEEDIVADYQVSFTYNSKGINKMVEQSPKLKEFVEQAGEDSMLHSHPKNIRAVLELLNSETVKDWLEENGVKSGLIQEFRKQMLTSGQPE